MTTTELIEPLFAGLISLQFVVIAAHDWIDVPGWVQGSQVRAVVGQHKLAWATLVNLIFPGVALVCAVRFFHASKPAFVLNYWVVYTAITVGSAFFMWWVPYLFGSSPERTEEYRIMYAGTRYLLPARKENLGPNAAHLVFHCIFLSTLVLAIVLRMTAAGRVDPSLFFRG